jgi:hypothetical protein
LCTLDAKSLIFFAQRVMDDACCASAADAKLDKGCFGMGLGKGLGILLRGVTVSFLSNNKLGHDDGNRAIFDEFFG